MTAPKSFSALSDGEHAVFQADPNTGILLDADGNYATRGEPHYYIFPTLADAERFADARQVEKPFSEWWICDASGQSVARRLALDVPSPQPEVTRASKLAMIAGWIKSLFRR
jgi:hypothetical protein